MSQTVDQYASKLRNLIRRVYPDNNLPVQAQISQFITGLQSHLRFHVQTASPPSLDEAIAIARRYETGYKQNQQPQFQMIHTPIMNNTSNEVSELAKTLKSIQEQLNQVQANNRPCYQNNRPNWNRPNQNQQWQQPRNNRSNWNNSSRPTNSNVTCFNCNQRGHISSQCPNFNRPPPSNRPSPSSNRSPPTNNQSDNYVQNDWSQITADTNDSSQHYLVNQQTPTPKPIAPIARAIEPYSIIQDLKDQKANITFGQLLQVAPSIRAELTHGLRKKKEETSAFNSLPSTRTTALYYAANINSIPITLIVDSGASSSVVSKVFLDDHNIHIERPSTVTMTNINGIKTTPLGAIDNFPITVGTITTPIKVDVTDAKTYSVIVGNDWLIHMRATIDYATANLTIRNDECLYQFPCTYLQERGEPVAPKVPIPQSQPEEEDAFDDI